MSPQPKHSRKSESLQREHEYGEPFRPYGVVIAIVAIVGIILVLLVSRSGTSCSGEQTVKIYPGDSLTYMILSNVDGSNERSTSLESIISMVTADQPELGRGLKDGETVTLPKSCSGNNFSSGWDRGQ